MIHFQPRDKFFAWNNTRFCFQILWNLKTYPYFRISWIGPRNRFGFHYTRYPKGHFGE